MPKKYSESKGRIGTFAAPHKGGRLGAVTLSAVSRPLSTDDCQQSRKGEVSEWLKEHAWKVCILERVSRVRIPPSPQIVYLIFLKEPVDVVLTGFLLVWGGQTFLGFASFSLVFQ